MSESDKYLDFINDQLNEFEGYETKKMFGGVGFFKEGIMFGLLGKGVFHFRVDDSNRNEYEAKGSKAFMSSEKKKGLPYYNVPIDVLENQDELKKWAEIAYQVAVKNKK